MIIVIESDKLITSLLKNRVDLDFRKAIFRATCVNMSTKFPSKYLYKLCSDREIIFFFELLSLLLEFLFIYYRKFL